MVSRVGSNQFSRRMRLRADRFEKNAERIVKDAATAALTVMATNTRVDTSRAVSNWIVTRDGPSSDYLPPHTPGRKGSTRGPSLAETLAYGRAEIEQFKMGMDRDLFITNNTPYLRFIDGQALSVMGVQAAKAALVGAKLFT